MCNKHVQILNLIPVCVKLQPLLKWPLTNKFLLNSISFTDSKSSNNYPDGAMATTNEDRES